MCAHYETLPEGPEPFAEYRLTWASPKLSETRGEMYPRYVGPVIRLRDGERGLDAMAWGLIPFWASQPDPKKFRANFNARAETIGTTASFRSPLKSRRCLVPAAAFTEFPTIGETKVKHRIARADGKPIIFAGLWDCWRRDDDELYTFTIITTESNEELRWLHGRMPVALPRPAQEAWLDPDLPPAEARALLVCPLAKEYEATPV
ncbi:MAG: SOS response-associated peptidase [Gemmatimonadota bacterium]